MKELKESKYRVCILILLVVLCVFIGAWLWPYIINSWLAYFGKEPALVWWQGVIIGFIPYIGKVTIPVAVVTWIFMTVLA